MKNCRRFLFFALVLVVSCRPATMPEQSTWTGSVDLPDDGISVPLRMDLDFSASKPSGYFLVGDEKTPIPEITRNGDALTLGFSEYSAQIRATWNGRELAGTYDRIRSDGTKSFKFVARPAEGSSSPSSQTASQALPPTGSYQVLFQGEDKVDDTTIAKFWSQGSELRGTFIAPDGDYGLLTGAPREGGFQLSRFTGWQAIAIVLDPQRESWTGRFYAASNPKPRAFALGARADAASQPDFKKTKMKDEIAPFSFSGVSLAGETVRHTDERFKGKALIVDIMGTWCHNCLDEAPVLQRLQNEFGKDGLEVVGLSFEISDDPVLAKKNLQLFRDRFGLTYTLLFCGSLDDENVKKQLHSQLDNFFAYPTAIFIDKNHKVRAIHSGFKGPGTGDEFQNQIKEFEDLAASLAGK